MTELGFGRIFFRTDVLSKFFLFAFHMKHKMSRISLIQFSFVKLRSLLNNTVLVIPSGFIGLLLFIIEAMFFMPTAYTHPGTYRQRLSLWCFIYVAGYIVVIFFILCLVRSFKGIVLDRNDFFQFY